MLKHSIKKCACLSCSGAGAHLWVGWGHSVIQSSLERHSRPCQEPLSPRTVTAQQSLSGSNMVRLSRDSVPLLLLSPDPATLGQRTQAKEREPCLMFPQPGPLCLLSLGSKRWVQRCPPHQPSAPGSQPCQVLTHTVPGKGS